MHLYLRRTSGYFREDFGRLLFGGNLQVSPFPWGFGAYLALTPAMAGVGRCHKKFWQMSAGVANFPGRCRQVSGNLVEAHGNTHTGPAGVGRCH